MFKTLKGICLLAFLSLGFRTGGGESNAVEILFLDGTVVSGEILALRDSTLVIAVPAGLEEHDILTGEHGGLMVVPHDDILKVYSEGSSYSLVGLASGCAVGCLAGALIGDAQHVEPQQGDQFGCSAAAENINNTTTGAAIGTLAGGLVGLAIGGAASSKDEIYVSPAQRNFKALTLIARYPGTEPEFLKIAVPR